jgi:hypothetical protein
VINAADTIADSYCFDWTTINQGPRRETLIDDNQREAVAGPRCQALSLERLDTGDHDARPAATKVGLFERHQFTSQSLDLVARLGQ